MREIRVKPKSHGFIVINTRSGEILSDLFKKRGEASTALDAIVKDSGSLAKAPNYVEYRNGFWYLPLGVHPVKLYPGEVYSKETYKP